MSEKLKFVNDGSVEKALKSFRAAEGDSFLVLGYADKSSLSVVAEGKGSLEEAKSSLPNNECRYVLIKKDLKVEMAKTVKFALVDWTPQGIPPLKRALLTTHKGQLKELLGSVHVTMPAGDEKDLDESALMAKIGDSAGVSSKITDKAATVAQVEVKKGGTTPASGERKTQSGPAKTPSIPTGSATLKFSDEAAFKEALKNVRDNNVAHTWMMARSVDKDTLASLGSGQGAVEDLVSKLEDDNVNFILLRVTEQIDKSTTVKFVYIKWQPENLAPMKKAGINVKTGEIEKAFTPFHVSLQISNKAELNTKDIVDKVAAASGTKSNIKTRD
jgi:hypothetical protein